MTPDPSAATRILPQGWDPEISERFGYSFGVRRGDHLWIAGQVAIDDRGGPLHEGDIEMQTRTVFDRLRQVVQAGGGGMGDVVRTTTYITTREHRPVTNELRREYFPGSPYPVNTLLIVRSLALPELLVEIEAEAVLSG